MNLKNILPDNWKSQALKGLLIIVLSIFGIEGAEQFGLFPEDEPAAETVLSFADYQADPGKYLPAKPDPAPDGECWEYWRIQGWALTTYEITTTVDVGGGNPHQAEGRGVGQSWLWVAEIVNVDAGRAFENSEAKRAFLAEEARKKIQARIGAVGHVFGRWFEDPSIYATRLPECE